MQKWKVLDSEYLYKTAHGNLRKDKCLLENDLVIEQYHVNEFADWVNAVVMTKKQEVILVKQYRHGGNDFFYEVPAGVAEEGESNTQAIKREVLEETGFQSDTEPIWLGEFFVNPATQNNKVISYFIPDAYPASAQNLDATENIEVHKIPIIELEKRINNGEILQMFSNFAFLLAKKHIN
ncbi:NUDIX hydrolase [Oceanobacillus sp. CFH 90083]|uniref:NUDIX hydrolase n=1 Tax=Oceanobacillus sp. CFH 90083 TaxID=2592336 RepID=UPI00128DEE5D|nr:NUDIX hydrolase [Oceanobacillus sp. CFH 90083]